MIVYLMFLEEYDGFKNAAYRTAMEIRPIKWLFIECFIGV